MSSDFFFSILRITCAQIFRSAGVDRCAPSLLDTVTDLFIRHLNLLATTAARNASMSGRNEVNIQDMALAMENIGLIKPFSVLDTENSDPAGMEGFDLFINWAKGPIPEEMRRVSGYANASAAQVAESGGEISNGSQLSDREWLTSLVKKHAKIDHELKLKGTLLAADGSDDVATFTKIAGGSSILTPPLSELSDDHEEEPLADEPMGE